MRTINSVKNPRWSDPTGYRIDVDVDFDELDEQFVPFTAFQNDCEVHSVEIFNRALSGEFGDIAEWVAPSDLTGSDAVDMMREQRNSKLSATDHVENPTYWARLSEDEKTAWTAYRNALRDMPDNVQDPVYECVVEIDSDDPTIYTKTYVANFEWPVVPK